MPDLAALEGTELDHLRLLLQKGGIGVWELETETGVAWRNLRHDQIFGYEALLSEWTYERFLDHVVPEDRDEVHRLYGTALERGEPWSFECRITRPDGERRWISATGRPLRGPNGKIARLIGHVIDITHTKRNEEKLRTVLHELNHRVRNTLTIIQSIAALSFPDDVSVAQGRRDFSGRIQALAQAHSLLTSEEWSGAKMADLVRNALAPYCDLASQASIEGPEVWLPAKTAVSLAMALNELATNAVKHGALSVPEGLVTVRWSCSTTGSERTCELTWTESGGPPAAEPKRQGFGLILIGSLMPAELGGEADIRFEEAGFRCRLCFTMKEGGELPL